MIEYKYLDRNWIKEKKKNLENTDYLHYAEDCFFETLDSEIGFFIQNADYTTKIKNHINVRYSASSTNKDLVFIGDIAIHNYEFLIDLYEKLIDYYEDDFDQKSNLYASIISIYNKTNELENDFFKYSLNPVFPKISEETIDPAIDLSMSKPNEKIIYLHKLGILDFLREQNDFKQSINLLATVLSAITGEKSGTIQSMLNPMYNTHVNDKNNPLKSPRAVPKVEGELTRLRINFHK